MDTQNFTFSLAIILISGIGCQWISVFTRVPSILLLLLTGIILGPVTGIIDPDRIFGDLLSSITTLSVAIILFEGGLSLRFLEAKKYGMIVNSLVTVGALACAVSIFLFLYYGLEFSFEFSLLSSAILVITGPTVVTPMLNHLHILPRTRSILKWEGILVDPIGAIAAVIIFEALKGASGLPSAETIFFAIFGSVFFGVLLGILGALVIIFSLRKFWIPDSIHSPVTLMMLLGVFTVSDLIHTDSGLIAVTVMGFILGNQGKAEVNHIINFKESLTVILISFLFISLAGTIKTDLLINTFHTTIFLLLFIIFVSRPLTVLFSGAFWKLERNEALFMCCIAPRGIVTAAMASLFGIELADSGFIEATLLTPITFGVIIGTVIFYSIFTPFAARWLGLSSATDKSVLIVGANILARTIAATLQKEGFEVQLIDPNFWKVAETKRSILPVFPGTFLEYEKKFPEKIESMDLILALTENDDINSLAIIHLRRHFDESDLYQLPACTKKIHESVMGQRLFGDEHNFETLSKLIGEGYVAISTKLSSNFTFQDWLEQQGDNSIFLFHINRNGVLIPETEENPLSPKDSGKIIYLSKKQ